MLRLTNLSNGRPVVSLRTRMIHKSTHKSFGIPNIIGAANGDEWRDRWHHIHSLINQSVLRRHLKPGSEDLTGSGVYSHDSKNPEATNYDRVNRWQVNYARGECNLQGALMQASSVCWNDDQLFGGFYSSRPGSVVLDVGCNTGRNLSRALKYGGLGTEVYGIEFSKDSAEIARTTHGQNRIFQGDASGDFVDDLEFAGKFSVVQCTAVLQHMTSEQVQRTLGNISRCLKPEGELLLTFKDAPTRDQLVDLGMDMWSEQIYSSDIADKDHYLREGHVRAVMWDDDYYPGVASEQPPSQRDVSLLGLHRREFVFYSLEWMKKQAAEHGMVAECVEVHLDSKIPHSALHWMVVFRRT